MSLGKPERECRLCRRQSGVIKGKGENEPLRQNMCPLISGSNHTSLLQQFSINTTMSDAEIMETALSTVSTGLAKTPPAPPTATATPSRPPATQVPPRFTRTPAPETYLIVGAGSHLNLWDGPGTQFKVIGSISQKRYPVIGKHADWWLLDLGDTQYQHPMYSPPQRRGPADRARHRPAR